MRPPTMTDEEADALWLEMCAELTKPLIEAMVVNDNGEHVQMSGRPSPGRRSYAYAYADRWSLIIFWPAK